ncbi:MAG: carboxypeptidase-like regulatory domain-containing protein [Polyangiaceae bacterium]
MDKLTWTGVSMVTLLSAMGCGGPGPSDASPSGEGPAATSFAGTGSTPAPSVVSIQGVVYAPDGSSLSRVSVCLEDSSTCGTSGDDGSFTLPGAPANEFVPLTFQKEGFLPSLRVVQTQTSDVVFVMSEILSPAAPSQTFMGAATDPSKGNIAFFVVSPDPQPAPRISVTMLGTGGSAPTYLGADGSPDVNATTGSTGGFVNVPAGIYVIQFGHAGTTCTASDANGYPLTVGQQAGEVTLIVPVAAGYVTTPVSVSCVSTQ